MISAPRLEVLGAFLLVACSSNAPVGPIGPAGPQGPAGDPTTPASVAALQTTFDARYLQQGGGVVNGSLSVSGPTSLGANLAVTGTTTVAGSIGLSTALTRYYSTAVSDFVSTAKTIPPWLHDGYILTRTNASQNEDMAAGLHLPDGATLVSVTCFGRDATNVPANQLAVSIYQLTPYYLGYTPNDCSTPGLMASGTGTRQVTVTNTCTETVHNQYAAGASNPYAVYGINLQSPAYDGSIAVFGCSVQYTVTSVP